MNSRMIYLPVGGFLLFMLSMVCLAAPAPQPGPPKLRSVLKGHKKAVLSLAFSPDGKLLASGSMDKSITLWDVATGKSTATFTGHTHHVDSVAFSPDGKLLASTALNDGLRLWDVASGKAIAISNERGGLSTTLVFSRDGKTIFNGSFWNVVTRKIRKNAKGGVPEGHRLNLQPWPYDIDGKLLAVVWSVGTRSGNKLWDVLANKELRTLETPEDGVFGQCSTFRPDSKVFASAGQWLFLWDVRTGKLIGSYKRPGDFTTALAYAPDGKLLAAGWRRGWKQRGYPNRSAISLLDPATGKELALLLEAHNYAIHSLAFSPGGTILASMDSGDNLIKLWDVGGVKAPKKE